MIYRILPSLVCAWASLTFFPCACGHVQPPPCVNRWNRWGTWRFWLAFDVALDMINACLLPALYTITARRQSSWGVLATFGRRGRLPHVLVAICGPLLCVN